MIVALEEAKRRLVALEDVLGELKNQLRIDEAKEKCADLERETLVQDFWNDAETSSRKLREIKQLKDKYESYEALVAKLEDTYTLCEMAIEANDEDSVEEVVGETEYIETEAERKSKPMAVAQRWVSQEERQLAYDNRETTDDHGMLIYGIAKDQKGTEYYMVKNSWGAAGAYKGIWYASKAFVRYKTMNIIVHKDAIPAAIREKLNL